MPRTLGDFHTLGSDCDSTGPSEVAELQARISSDCAKTGAAAGRPPACSDARQVAQVLDIVADIGLRVASGVQAVGQVQLQKTVKQGQAQMRQGQQQMADNGQVLNDSMDAWLGEASNYNILNQQLSSIASTLSGVGSQLNSINSQLAQATQAVNDANARVAAAANPANYPRPSDPRLASQVLAQQRNDSRAANTALRDASLAQASLQNQQSQLVSIQNQAVADGRAVESQLAQTQANAQAAQARANQAQEGIRQGQQTFGKGAQTIRGGLENFQEIQRGVTASVETANGLRGTSQVIKHIDSERFYSASAVPFSEGYAMYARQSGNPALVNAAQLVSSAINSAAGAMDRGGDGGQMAQQFFQDFGQATLQTGTLMNIADQVALADCIGSNPNNPNATYDALSHLNTQVAPLIDAASKIGQTFSPFFPGGAAVAPALPYVSAGLGTLATGLGQTFIEAANTAVRQGGLSAPIQAFVQRTGPGGSVVGRPGSLPERTSGGQPSAGTVTIAGLAVALGNTATSIVKTAINSNPNTASRTQSTIQQIARTGTTPPLRAGDITLRPPAAVPVRPPTVIGGD